MAYWREMPGGSSSAVNLQFCCVPIIIPSSGIIGNNGALSAITALPLAFPHCFMYFPANAIVAGSAAGLYYVQMSLTTAGTIYNNVLDFANPAIPASPTAFVTVGPGAYVQTTGADIVLFQYTMPGGTMGINSIVNTEVFWSYSNSANTKTLKQKFGAITAQQYTPTTTTSVLWHADTFNRGTLDTQTHSPFNVPGHTGASSGVAQYSGIDTSADVIIQETGQLAALGAADFIILNRAHVELD